MFMVTVEVTSTYKRLKELRSHSRPTGQGLEGSVRGEEKVTDNFNCHRLAVQYHQKLVWVHRRDMGLKYMSKTWSACRVHSTLYLENGF